MKQVHSHWEITDEGEHGIDSALWNNLGGGWQIICLCGWGTACYKLMADTGHDFDDHLLERHEEATRQGE